MVTNSQGISLIPMKKPTWKFYFLWVAANAIGMIVGAGISFLFVLSVLGAFDAPMPEGEASQTPMWITAVLALIVFAPLGGILGFMQWLVVQDHIRNSALWSITPAIALYSSMAIQTTIAPSPYQFHLPSLFFFWFFFGGLSGVFQWLILRRQLNYSGLWILANFVAGAIAGILFADQGIVGGGIGWALTGFLTSATLFLLFRTTERSINAQTVA